MDSKSGTELARKLAPICSGHSRHNLEQMYRIRSKVEHLHGPERALSGSYSAKKKHHVLVERTVQAEALSRYLLTTALGRGGLWRRFVSRRGARAFWQQSPTKIRAEWSSVIPLRDVARSINWSEVTRHYST